MIDNVPAIFFPASVDACALYRQYQPHLNLEGSLFMIPLVKLSDGNYAPGPINIDSIKHCKVAIVQRLVSELNRGAMQSLKAAGLKLVYDLDDNVWSLPAYNPSKKEFKAVGAGFRECAKEADAITVSTQGLKSATKSALGFSKEIFIVPNAIDLNLFHKKSILREDNSVVIGWGGSNTHSGDVGEVFDIIASVLDENANVRMEIVGAPAKGIKEISALNHQGRKITKKVEVDTKIGLHPQTNFRPWVPVPEYANRLASWAWDISVAPLDDNRFNRSKSNIKLLEAAAIGIPCLVSDVQPYREFCELGGEELKWLLCSTHSQWKNKLLTLIHEPERRDYLAQKMYVVTEKFFNAKNIAQHWSYVFNYVLGN